MERLEQLQCELWRWNQGESKGHRPGIEEWRSSVSGSWGKNWLQHWQMPRYTLPYCLVIPSVWAACYKQLSLPGIDAVVGLIVGLVVLVLLLVGLATFVFTRQRKNCSCNTKREEESTVENPVTLCHGHLFRERWWIYERIDFSGGRIFLFRGALF